MKVMVHPLAVYIYYQEKYYARQHNVLIGKA